MIVSFVILMHSCERDAMCNNVYFTFLLFATSFHYI